MIVFRALTGPKGKKEIGKFREAQIQALLIDGSNKSMKQVYNILAGIGADNVSYICWEFNVSHE